MNNLFGVIIFSNEVRPQPLSRVVAAAAHAGINPDWVRGIRPKNAFIRAVRQLKKEGAITDRADGILAHKYQDDQQVVRFQFSQTYLRGFGVEYDKAAVISFMKEEQSIVCDNEKVLEVAQRLYATVQHQYNCTDIQNLVKRVIEKNDAKRIPLRDGVYFLPVSKQHVAEQVKKFFEHLDCTFFVMPVNSASGEKTNLIKAAVDDMRASVLSMQAEVKELKTENKLTPAIAKARLALLHKELKQYREISAALQEDAETLFQAAGTAGKSLSQTQDGVEGLIASVQGGDGCTELVYDLVEAAEPELKLPLRESVLLPETDVEAGVANNVEQHGAALVDIGS